LLQKEELRMGLGRRGLEHAFSRTEMQRRGRHGAPRGRGPGHCSGHLCSSGWDEKRLTDELRAWQEGWH
jgi:hypothetical protein